MATKFIVLLLVFFVTDVYCDWASEWMTPINELLNDPIGKTTGDEDVFSVPVTQDTMITEDSTSLISGQQRGMSYDMSMNELKMKLASTLSNAKLLADNLKSQILMMSSKENTLKDAIANGRSGVSTVTVTTQKNNPRTYIIRDGFWALCNGMVQHPGDNGLTNNLFGDVLSIPRCIGNEVTSVQDPCVFNSIIKYETVPTRRRIEYFEDAYLCLKVNFNSTMEQYLSVPRQVVNATCRNGAIRSVAEVNQMCGIRILSEYTYYPQRSSSVAAILPLDYCDEKNGACKLMVAWHVSNKTVDNFEFFKDENNFKKLFMKPGLFGENVQ